MLISTGGFTEQLRDEAASEGVLLIDRDTIFGGRTSLHSDRSLTDKIRTCQSPILSASSFSLLILSSIGGWVLNRLESPPFFNGLEIHMLAQS